MSKIVDLVKKAGTFYIATVDGDQPKVRPFGAIEDIDGKIYLVTGNQKAFFKQISANPKVESVASFEDHSWLRVTGTLSVPRCQKKLQETYLSIRTSLQKIYKAGDGIFEVLELKNPVAELHPYGGGEVQHIKD